MLKIAPRFFLMQNQNEILFSTRNSFYLAKKIASSYGKKLGNLNFVEFKDGEFELSLEESVRGYRVFIIGSTFSPADNLMELLLICDAANRASAKNITLVIPYFGWARQDRKNKPRSPIAAKLVSNIIEASGVARIITMDLHSDQIQGFFKIPIDHFYAYNIFIKYIKDLNLKKITIASPDPGGTKRANNLAYDLESEVVICYKERIKANKIENVNILGEVKGKNVILIDDLVDTAETLILTAEIMLKKGANSIRALVTHPVLSGNAYERISHSNIEELLVTDTIPLKKNYSCKIKVLSCASFLAERMQICKTL